jgi:hypothetical protein
VKLNGTTWVTVPPADAVQEFVTSRLQALQAASAFALDLTTVSYPIACLVPEGEGSASQNEAVLYRDSERTVGFPIGYAPPLVVAAAVVDASRVSSCQPVAFPPAVPVPSSGLSPILLANTSSSRVALWGMNFGRSPVVYAGITLVPAVLCVHNHTYIEFEVPEGEGTGYTFTPIGFTVALKVADQGMEDQQVRLQYGPPRLVSVDADVPTAGNETLHITGWNFGVSTPTVWIGASLASAVQCTGVQRLSHRLLSCVVPPVGTRGCAASPPPHPRLPRSGAFFSWPSFFSLKFFVIPLALLLCLPLLHRCRCHHTNSFSRGNSNRHVLYH